MSFSQRSRRTAPGPTSSVRLAPGWMAPKGSYEASTRALTWKLSITSTLPVGPPTRVVAGILVSKRLCRSLEARYEARVEGAVRARSCYHIGPDRGLIPWVAAREPGATRELYDRHDRALLHYLAGKLGTAEEVLFGAWQAALGRPLIELGSRYWVRKRRPMCPSLATRELCI